MEVLNRGRKVESTTYTSDYEFYPATTASTSQTQYHPQQQQQPSMGQQFGQQSTTADICKASDEENSLYNSFYDPSIHHEDLTLMNIDDSEVIMNASIKNGGGGPLERNENQQFLNNHSAADKHLIEFDKTTRNNGPEKGGGMKNIIELNLSTNNSFQQQEGERQQQAAGHHCYFQTHLNSQNEKRIDLSSSKLVELVTIPYRDLISRDDLHEIPGEYLNDMHRDLEVQSMDDQLTTGTFGNVLLGNG